MKTQWQGKKVAFFGDSITDKCHVGTAKNYWQFLQDYLEIEPLVYGINGWQWDGVIPQAEALMKEHGTDVDAIFIFMGTNDFNCGLPLGDWWTIRQETINSHGKIMSKPCRIFTTDMGTLCGRINAAMAFLKKNFPYQQIVLMTPIHRGFADFGGDNVQPEESYPNDIGLYVESYIEKIRQAGDIWSVPVIDLYAESGLFPIEDAFTPFFHDPKTDRLHPSAEGHDRMAKVMTYKMLAMPATFR